MHLFALLLIFSLMYLSIKKHDEIKNFILMRDKIYICINYILKIIILFYKNIMGMFLLIPCLRTYSNLFIEIFLKGICKRMIIKMPFFYTTCMHFFFLVCTSLLLFLLLFSVKYFINVIEFIMFISILFFNEKIKSGNKLFSLELKKRECRGGENTNSQSANYKINYLCNICLCFSFFFNVYYISKVVLPFESFLLGFALRIPIKIRMGCVRAVFMAMFSTVMLLLFIIHILNE